MGDAREPSSGGVDQAVVTDEAAARGLRRRCLRGGAHDPHHLSARRLPARPAHADRVLTGVDGVEGSPGSRPRRALLAMSPPAARGLLRMSELLDLRPACAETARVAAAVRDDQLHAPTPCEEMDVSAVLGHLLGLALAFTPGAPEQDGEGGAPTADLDPAWREVLPARLTALAQAWRHPAPYGRQLEAGGVVMEGDDAAAVALDEVVLHGWDLARATGQRYDVDDGSTAVVLAFTTAVAAPGEEWSREGLFGPAVPVEASAPPFERALGLAGRDPGWRPPSSPPSSSTSSREDGSRWP